MNDLPEIFAGLLKGAKAAADGAFMFMCIAAGLFILVIILIITLLLVLL